jgi:hypothetical protein
VDNFVDHSGVIARADVAAKNAAKTDTELFVKDDFTADG